MLEPIIISLEVYEFLHNYAWSLVPKRRNIVLAWDIFKPKDINPNHKALGKDTIAPPYCIVFAIRIVNEFIYQPIGTIYLYYTSSSEKLAKCIKAYIEDLSNCDLKVVATVCSANEISVPIVHEMAKIEKETTDAIIYDTPTVKNIVHIYNPPHLLIATRDAFFESEIEFVFNNTQYSVYYEDIKVLMKRQPESIFDANLRANNESETLTETAAKLFSETFSKEIIKSGSQENMSSAIFCKFFDQLFDSFNTFDEISPKYREIIKCGSKHFSFWSEAVPILESMKFTIKSENPWNKVNRGSNTSSNTKNEKTFCNYKTKIPRHLKRVFRTTKLIGPENEKDTFKNIIIDLLKLKCLVEAKKLNISAFNTPEKILTIDPNVVFEEYYHPNFIHHWIISIKGMEIICKNLFEKGFTAIRTKTINADVIHEIVQNIKVFRNNVKSPLSTERNNYLTTINPPTILTAFEASSSLTIY